MTAYLDLKTISDMDQVSSKMSKVGGTAIYNLVGLVMGLARICPLCCVIYFTNYIAPKHTSCPQGFESTCTFKELLGGRQFKLFPNEKDLRKWINTGTRYNDLKNYFFTQMN